MLIRIVPNRNEAKGMSSLQPPSIPPDVDYQAYYCEENIWRLCQQPLLQAHKSEVVFISNPRRTCALWYQRAAPYPTEPVVWDYHVILLTQTLDNTWQVWDLDTLLGCPLRAEDYFSMTFWGTPRIPAQYAPRFRTVPAGLFLQHFSSDRSHMRDEQGHYMQPPPPWDAPQRGTESTNLMRFVDVIHEYIGEVMSLADTLTRYTGDANLLKRPAPPPPPQFDV